MMAYQQSLQAYQTNSVNTANPGELTLMLYNGALKFLKQSKAAISEKKFDKANEYIKRVQEIVGELMVTLDQKYPIAQQMMPLYEYMQTRLIEANLKKETSILDEVEGLLTQFRDTWKQAMVLAKTQG